MSTETETRKPATGQALNALEFGSIFTIYPEGTFREHAYGEGNEWAPECYSWEGCDIDTSGATEWDALNGLSGQDRYAGAVMHESEFIGEGLAEYLRMLAADEPRTFTVVVVSWLAPEGEEAESDYAYGWAILVRK